MVWIAAALGTLIGAVVGWTYGALWAHEKTKRCKECGCDRVCPKCKKLMIMA